MSQFGLFELVSGCWSLKHAFSMRLPSSVVGLSASLALFGGQPFPPLFNFESDARASAVEPPFAMPACRQPAFPVQKPALKAIIDWYMGALQTGGYPVIILMMAMESTILPLPSELIIPPAANLAYTHPEGRLAVWGVILAGTLGSWLGATIMYWTARAAGRPPLMRYGRYVLISPEKIEGAERWAAKFGSMGVFISRLLPVVRHLIGIPAGIVRMDYKLFSLFTILGSGLWCAILAWLGIKVGQNQRAGAYHQTVILVAGAVILLGAVYYFFVHRHMKKGPANK
jgi:membrane protein DedA with SNARE-associated domain